jgi:hypothetical protein
VRLRPWAEVKPLRVADAGLERIAGDSCDEDRRPPVPSRSHPHIRNVPQFGERQRICALSGPVNGLAGSVLSRFADIFARKQMPNLSYGLLHPVPEIRRVCACHAVCEFDSDRVISPPEHAAFAGATFIASNLQHEFIRDGTSPHARNLRAAVRKVAQNARTDQMAFQVMDCCWRVPFNPKVLSALASHSRIPIVEAQMSTTSRNSEQLTKGKQRM